jgi:hypothetical protein
MSPASSVRSRVRAASARLSSRWSLLVAAVLLGAPAALSAQALNYPALQIPSVSDRDYTGAVVGSNGTMMMFQWREGISPEMHWGLDVGLYDPSARNSRTALFLAGNLGYDMARANADQPLDLLLTAGAGFSVANSNTSVRLPIGLVLGHRFELDQGMAITPFVHPRLSIDICSSCGGNDRSQSDVSLNFDIGGSFEINRRLSVRVSALFSGAEQYGSDDAIAVALTWTPEGLRR